MLPGSGFSFESHSNFFSIMNNSIDGNQKLKKAGVLSCFFLLGLAIVCDDARHPSIQCRSAVAKCKRGRRWNSRVCIVRLSWLSPSEWCWQSLSLFFLFEINKQISIYGRSSTLHQSVLERWKHISMVSYAILTHSFIECVLRDWRNVEPREEERVENISHIQ